MPATQVSRSPQTTSRQLRLMTTLTRRLPLNCTDTRREATMALPCINSTLSSCRLGASWSKTATRRPRRKESSAETPVFISSPPTLARTESNSRAGTKSVCRETTRPSARSPQAQLARSRTTHSTGSTRKSLCMPTTVWERHVASNLAGARASLLLGCLKSLAMRGRRSPQKRSPQKQNKQ